MTIQAIIDRLGPGMAGVYIGKDYTVLDLKRDLLELCKNDARMTQRLASY